MKAFHGDPAIQQKYVDRIRAHREAEVLVRGIGWEVVRGEPRGCAVGCTLEAYDHSRYPIELGLPEALGRLEDVIFESLPDSRWPTWPEAFLLAAKPGSDQSRTHWQFLHWLLTDEKVNPGITHELVRDAVAACAAIMADLATGREVPESAASAARSAASAAWSAESAAWSAESAASAAWSAAWSAARSAAYVLMADKLLSLMREAT